MNQENNLQSKCCNQKHTGLQGVIFYPEFLILQLLICSNEIKILNLFLGAYFLEVKLVWFSKLSHQNYINWFKNNQNYLILAGCLTNR